MKPPKKPVIAFLSGDWTNVDDRIRQGKAPGGVPSVYLIWQKCLERGFDVHVFILADIERDFPKETTALGGIKFHWIRQPLSRTAAWLEKRGLRGIFSPVWPMAQSAMAWRLWRSGVRADIYYSMRRTFLLLSGIASRLTGRKVVLRTYGTWLHYAGCEQDKWRHKIRNIGERLAMRKKVDLHIMTNDGTSGDKVARRAGFDMRKFRFWLNGVDKNMRLPDFDAGAFKQRLELSPDAPVIVQVGRLDSWKRQDLIIDAMPAILEEFPDARVFLIGGGPLRQALEERAGRLGATQSVTFVGPVAHNDIKGYLNAADVYAQGQDLSNLSSTLIEALMAGCCVVTRDVGATTEIVTHDENAVVLKPGQADDFAQAIISLLGDPARRRRLGQAAWERAMREFQTWDERMDMEVDELEALLIDRSPR